MSVSGQCEPLPKGRMCGYGNDHITIIIEFVHYVCVCDPLSQRSTTAMTHVLFTYEHLYTRTHTHLQARAPCLRLSHIILCEQRQNISITLHCSARSRCIPKGVMPPSYCAEPVSVRIITTNGVAWVRNTCCRL